MSFQEAPLLLTLGLLFLLGLAADLIGRHTIFPRVTLLIVAGLAVGPTGFNLLPMELVDDWFPPMTTVALSLIGFLLGPQLSLSALRAQGNTVVSITIGETSGAVIVVALALWIYGVNPVVALLLAGIGAASAPAATFDVVHESHIHNRFSNTLLAVVALDDAIGLLLFSVAMALATALVGTHSPTESLLVGVKDIGGSVLLGAALGVPMAYLSGRIRPGEPTLAEAIGFVLICGGIATWLDLSPVLAAMVMGSVVATLATHHDRPFHAIEGIEWPFMILFFILAGASAHAKALLAVGSVTAVYIVARCVGTYAGAWTGATALHADPVTRKWVGFCLFPQAGVSIGMALMASQRFPQFEAWVLPVILASTVLYELTSPVITRRALLASRAAGSAS